MSKISDIRDRTVTEEYRKKRRNRQRQICIKIIILMLIPLLLLILFRFGLGCILVNGESMSPTLHSGNIIRTTTDFSEDTLTYGDIITFSKPPTGADTLIKRIVGLPGDTVEVRPDGVYRNGEKVYEPKGPDHPDMITHCNDPVTLKAHEFFVLGDNHNHSVDSRYFGPVTYDLIRRKYISTFIHSGD